MGLSFHEMQAAAQEMSLRAVLDEDLSNYTLCDDGRYEVYTEYTDDAVSEVDKHKNITVNEEQCNLTQEENSQYVPFKLPRYWDGVDLMTKLIQFHYVNINGGSGISTAVNVRFNDSYIICGWLINKSVTAVAGDVTFEITATGTNEKSADYRWRTRPNGKFTVLEALSYDGIIEPSDDWYAGFVKSMQEYTTKAAESARSAQDYADQSKSNLDQVTQITETFTTNAQEVKETAINEINNAKVSGVNAVEAAATEIVNDREKITENANNISSLKGDLDKLANATTNYGDEENEEDVDTTEIIGTLIFTSNYLHVNTNITDSGMTLKCPVSKGEKYRVVCSYFNSIYTVGYGLTQSDDYTTDIFYFDSSATYWMDNQIFDVEVKNDGYLYAYGRKNYNVSIKKLVSTRAYTSKSYDKETTDTKYVHSKPIFEKGAVLFSFDAMNLTDGRLDIMNEYGYRATAQTGHPTQTISQNKLDVIKGLRKAGWEIATYANLNFPVDTYGIDVACADEPTQEVIDAWDFYVSESIKGENAHGVFFPIVWNCRQGLFCTGLKMALEKYGYKMARGDYPIYAKRVECFGENYSFNVGSLGMYVNKVAETKARIDRAVNEKCGMVIFSHGLYSTDEDALANYGTTESVMREILDYVKSYVNQDKLDVLTYHELYARYFPNDCYERDYMRTMASIGYLSD